MSHSDYMILRRLDAIDRGLCARCLKQKEEDRAHLDICLKCNAYAKKREAELRAKRGARKNRMRPPTPTPTSDRDLNPYALYLLRLI